MMNKKKLIIEIGNTEAEKIRQRMTAEGINQTALAIKVDISLRYMGRILSVNKQEKLSVDKKHIDKILETLGIGSNYIFDTIPYEYGEEYLFNKFKEWTNKDLYTMIKEPSEYKSYSKNETLKKTNCFAHTMIGKNIADHHPSIRNFFEENLSFSVTPEQGYWRTFTTSPDIIEDSYFCFTIKPKKSLSHFKIAYSIKSQIPSTSIPNQIKINYAEIECKEDCIVVIQYYNNPSYYKIKPSENITVITWIDKAEHDFIIMSDDDFELEAEVNYKNAKTKAQVKEMIFRLDAVVFQKHPFFHRDKIGDIGDDAAFFWRNDNFLAFNPDIKSHVE
jgi:transcriptional regulator with XRE-family HTH domain